METFNNNLVFQVREEGQSFFEVVIALAIISIVLIALVGLASASIKASVFSRNESQANRYSEQAMEWIRGEKDAGWGAFYIHTATASWCLDSLYWQNQGVCGPTKIISGTVFTRNLTFTRNADGSVQAVVKTTWTDAQGLHTAADTALFTSY